MLLEHEVTSSLLGTHEPSTMNTSEPPPSVWLSNSQVVAIFNHYSRTDPLSYLAVLPLCCLAGAQTEAGAGH